MFPFEIWNMGYSVAHQYTFVMNFRIGGKIIKCKVFPNRAEAEIKMHKMMRKHKLTLIKVWDDKHDKTYICNKGVEFHINRTN